jgi:hypothetical protein
MIEFDTQPRTDLTEAIYAAEHSLKDVACKRTISTWRQTPTKVKDTKLSNIVPLLIDAIAQRFPEHARHYLSTLMVAWLKRDRRDFESWLDNDREMMRNALRGVEQLPDAPILEIAYSTILGLASLYEGLHMEHQPRERLLANKQAEKYWSRVEELGIQSGVLQGYLRHRIRAWLGCAAFNAVDTEIALDEVKRDELSRQLKSLNVIAELTALEKLLPQDSGPLFNRAIFATVLRDWTEAANAWLRIEELDRSDRSRYFKKRLECFRTEPIVDKEWPQIKQAAETLCREHCQTTHTRTKRR